MNFYTRNKAFVNAGLISGLLFALVMAGFDYFREQPFSLLKFALHFVLFGAFNGYMAYRKHKKENTNNK